MVRPEYTVTVDGTQTAELLLHRVTTTFEVAGPVKYTEQAFEREPETVLVPQETLLKPGVAADSLTAD